ncbi:ROK family transcriptional regulator [Actinomyces massiliensis]|uniref:ROK family protein n=1 Tax=Actinomyces massiliensis F0489 TaxID=1125718 RepID=J1GVR3_9ACTO|nr:ROK family transcriptional regulator [Actinomyces massiliensis]EJF37003.1 ROK family protein [Actinomyces massiliensis F0489]WLD72272.1 ROK family transcriptional regulator [Actinomyces massiliensis]
MARSTRTRARRTQSPSPESRRDRTGGGPPDAVPSARQSSLRTSNLALLAGRVFSAPEPVSRADIAAATGMTRSTASRLADELVAIGLVRELDPVASSGPGRPAVPLLPARGTFVALGLEVNVSRMAVRAVDLAGQVLAERIVVDDFSSSDAPAVLGRLADLLEPIAAIGAVGSARLVGAALALPGLVRDNTLLRAPNLGWSDIRPAEVLAPVLDRLGAKLVVGNEADLAALTTARVRPGAPGEHRDFIYLSGENGIGAGIVRDGEVWLGANGFAGEIGHIQVDPKGPECGCGNRGCLERFAGRRAILNAAGLPRGAGSEELLKACEDDASPHHERARRAIDAAADALGIALGTAINILDIPAVVLGGHLAPLTGLLAPPLQKILSRRVLASRWSAPQILPAPDDETPGATGGAWSLLEGVIADPAAWA